MYQQFFGLAELPFSIVPNSRYLYLSQRHQEAISHLQEGLGDGGGWKLFVMSLPLVTGKKRRSKNSVRLLTNFFWISMLLVFRSC